LRFWDGKAGGIWEPHYPGGERTNWPNKELQYYVDPRPWGDLPAIARLNPFAIEDGMLVIRARPIPCADQILAQHLSYASGLLTTYPPDQYTASVTRQTEFTSPEVNI
jgi:hypothetical protein